MIINANEVADEVTGVDLTFVPFADARMATAAYLHGFAIDNWVPGCPLSMLEKREGNSETVRLLAQAFFEGTESLQFRVLRIPRRE